MKDINNSIIFKSDTGEILLKGDTDNETIWANLDQIADLFDRNKSTISRHIKNIYETGELDKKVVVAYFATTTKHGAIKGKTQTKQVEYFNLDMIISIGYRVNSKVATNFRKWATGILKDYMIDGYSINPSRISKNYDKFMLAVEDIKKLSSGKSIDSEDILELIKSFANTWFNLENFDKGNLPDSGYTRDDLKLDIDSLYRDIEVLKSDLIDKDLATELFAQEKNKDNLAGIFGNIFATFDGVELYETLEEKAAHILYFVVKNHPFNDGNKRTGAFCFVWFLNKYNYDNIFIITPETLTTLTLLIAQSDPKEKDKMIGLILLLLKK